MNSSQQKQWSNSYLDVTEFILTHHRLKIPSPQIPPMDPYQNDVASPSNLPLMIEVGGVELSPYFSMGQNATIEYLDFALEMPEDDEQDQMSSNECEEQSEIQSDENSELEDESSFSQDNKLEQSAPQQSEFLDLPPSKLNLKYFKQSISQMRQKKATENQMKEFIFDFLTPENLDEENYATATIDTLMRMAESNLRAVGPISWLERRAKVLKFKSKKSKRSWTKKINYDCRKKVADNRLRVKGKFVTKQQACSILGVEEISEENLKELLELKFNKTSC